MMKIAIASGKGGTGKTTVATNLAFVASAGGRSVAYLDCDVEEPNGHLFLRPKITKRTPIGFPTPQVDETKCEHCGRCSEICQFSAIVCVKTRVLVYPALCHACGGCERVCPTGAISETTREIGWVETGSAEGISFAQGTINVGEAMSPPLIAAVKSTAGDADLQLLDAPPGTSCPVIESVRGADFVLLVTEPTPFGLHDLTLAVGMMRRLALPFGVIVNRADAGNRSVANYCHTERIRVLAEIPDNRRIAEAYAQGMLAVAAVPGIRQVFEELLAAVVGARAQSDPAPTLEADTRAQRRA